MPLNFTLRYIVMPTDQATGWSVRGSNRDSDMTCTGAHPVFYYMITGRSFPWIKPFKA
jgi:hypothetical protein